MGSAGSDMLDWLLTWKMNLLGFWNILPCAIVGWPASGRRGDGSIGPGPMAVAFRHRGRATRAWELS